MREYIDFNEIPQSDLNKPRLFNGHTIEVFESEEEYSSMYPDTIDIKALYTSIIENIIYNKAIELDYLSVNDVNLFDVEGGYWKEEALYFKRWQSSLWNYYYDVLNIPYEVSVEEFTQGMPEFDFKK